MTELLTLPNVLAGLVVLALGGYVLLGGADFGGGVWTLLASGPRRDAQRSLVEEAIGPIWEANHVWLILAIVLLFTCFPPAFALLGTVLHIPLTLMLIGIVLRGSAFAFRAHQELPSAAVRRWERVFAVASTATPVFLGVCLGAVASGAVRPPQGRDFVAGFVAPWLTPFCFAVGALALSLFAFLAAVYLTLEARETALREDFRRRALGAAVAVLATAAGCLALAPAGAPRIASALLSLRALPLQLAAAAAAIGAVAALWLRRYVLARVAAAAQASVILWGWALAQYPYLVPPTQTIRAAAAPEPTLRLVLWSLAAGACALFPSLFYLFRVFKGGRRDELRRD